MIYLYPIRCNFILIEQISMLRPQYIHEVIRHNCVPNILYGVYFLLFVWINLLINHMKCQVYENIFFVFLCDTYFEGVPQNYIETSCIFITCCLQQEYGWVQDVELTWINFILFLRASTKHVIIQSLSYFIYVNTWHPFVSQFLDSIETFWLSVSHLAKKPSFGLYSISKITERNWE